MKKYDYDKCKKIEKQLLYGLCIKRGLMTMTCSVDGKKCIAFDSEKWNIK